MIIGIFGNLSSGKTLLAVKLLKDEMDKNPNTKIISNIYLKFPYKFLDMESLVTEIISNKEQFENALLFIDEGHNIFESRRSTSKVNVDTTRFITQIGKLNCNLIFTSQMFSQADIRIRELCDILCFCARIDKNGRPLILQPRIVDQKIFIEVRIMIKLYGGLSFTAKIVRFNPEPYFNLYETKEIVVLDRDKYLVKNTFFSN